MSRPDHVRCENCCYWNEGTPHVEHGECVRYPQSRLKLPGYCGEFRAEWPEEVPPRFGITSGCICGKCDSCIERGVTP